MFIIFDETSLQTEPAFVLALGFTWKILVALQLLEIRAYQYMEGCYLFNCDPEQILGRFKLLKSASIFAFTFFVLNKSIQINQLFTYLTIELNFQSNASSGMGVADHCKHTYLELQRKKVHRYVIFKIDEKRKEVIVEKTGFPAESYDDFMAALPENDCRYAIYDFDFVTQENCQKSKIFFIAW